MNIKSTTEEIKTRWYNRYNFPLIPVFERKLGDQYNTPGFRFRWLFLKIWSLDCFEFELAFVLSYHWGIGLTAIIPYLRIVIHIPFSMNFQMWLQKKLSRKPPRELRPDFDYD